MKLGVYYDKRSTPVAEEFMQRREKRGYDRTKRRDRSLQDLRIHQADEARTGRRESTRLAMRRTIDASDGAAVVSGMKARNNGRYNGNGRHWATPPEVFDPLHAEFACARFFDEETNGLAQPWTGERVFMNPPYGREIYAWTRKARYEVDDQRCPLVVGLLPASTDLAWWHEDVIGCCARGANPRDCRGLPQGKAPIADVLRWYRGRIRFLTGGPYRASGFFPSVAVAWRA